MVLDIKMDLEIFRNFYLQSTELSIDNGHKIARSDEVNLNHDALNPTHTTWHKHENVKQYVS